MENDLIQALNQSFDPGNQYSVPYFGYFGDYLQYQDGQKMLQTLVRFPREYRNDIMMYDGAREVMEFGSIPWAEAQWKDPKKQEQ